MKKTILLSLTLSLMFISAVSAQMTSDIEEYLEKRMQSERIPGMSIALISENGHVSYHNFGYTGLNHSQLVTEETIFEAGSITKTLTAGMLRVLMDEFGLSADTPVQSFYEEVNIPSKDGVEITLYHLASHTSGLPRLPDNLDPADVNDPYNEYNPEALYQFLNNHELSRRPDEQFEYSNLAYMLLGDVLAKISGESYHQLMKRLYLRPLGLDNTKLTYPTDASRMAEPTSAGLPAKRWHSEMIPGHGGMLSTSTDLADYIRGHLGYIEFTHREALLHNIEPKLNLDGPFHMGYAWIVSTAFEDTVAFHGGGTGGYRAFAGFSPVTGRGAVVLSNGTNDVQDIGRHLINSQYALAQIVETIEMTEVELTQFIGMYQSDQLPDMTIYLENGTLLAKLGPQPEIAILPVDDLLFFSDRVDAYLEFQSDENHITGFVLKQGGSEIPFIRLD
jgi:serine-type D-Ala-D-Ala carboxypeptidase/endopeptidase